MTSLGLYVCLLMVVVAQAVMTTYRKGREKDVEALDKSGKGGWTDWLDRDIPTPYGTGEFEDVDRQRWEDRRRGECKMWCDKPLAMEMDLSPNHANSSTATIEDVMKCAEIDSDSPVDGFLCHNSYNRGKKVKKCDANTCYRNGLKNCEVCPNVKVRYFCEGVAADGCNLIQQRNLDMEETIRAERGMGTVFRRFMDTDASDTIENLDLDGDREELLDRMTKEFREFASNQLDDATAKKREQNKRSSLLSLMKLLERAIDES